MYFPAGGGGWGNPYERNPDHVLSDVVQGYVSETSAKQDYGVAIKTEHGEYVIDESETKRLREQQDTQF